MARSWDRIWRHGRTEQQQNFASFFRGQEPKGKVRRGEGTGRGYRVVACMMTNGGQPRANRTTDKCVESGDRVSDLVPSKRGQRHT